MDYRTAVEKFAADNTSGAQRMTEKAAALLVARLAQKNFTATEARQVLAQIARDLIFAQPAMASLFNLFNAVFERHGIDF